ncbi:hypothetical protein MAPG_10570 [Magnaporthiopsis poae ATCC 64411]|uniref:DUF7924 domain-containing protein n=1 Tax=Magnaporthiopsis poae (strain ATCC 64411 / 73-15) TaxID=644358 RepID=A0A0C4ECY1_MAGP6|nr:hypothetical protein MAPG_10570 [Magnaporthiopsis poae ATCC 64411]
MLDSSRTTTPLQSRHESEDLDRDRTPVQARKRRPGKTAGPDPPSPKRTRLTEADARERGIGAEGAQHAHETTLYHPEPIAPGQTASFLRDFAQIHHNPCPFVCEWLESVVTEPRCRSDGYLFHSADPAKELRRSVSEMGTKRDADGNAIPPTLASTWLDRRDVHAGSVAPSGLTGTPSGLGRLSGKSLVEDACYRDWNLAANDIFLLHPCDPIPAHITSIIDGVRRGRDSPGPSLNEIRQDRDLLDLSLGAPESEVENYFRRHIFPHPRSSDTLKLSEKRIMARHTVPNSGSTYRVSTPVPDMLYGYNGIAPFPQQRAQLISMGSEMVANGELLTYPFLAVEFKGDGPTGAGSLMVATNQCIGASTSCVNIAERLRRRLDDCDGGEMQPVDTVAFSIAMSGTEARLHISWKQDELNYYMAQVDSFLLQKPQDYLDFRKCVLNILDWGKGQRLQQIRNSLDSLLESSRREKSSAAKSRPSPSDGLGPGRNKRHRPNPRGSAGAGGGPAQQPDCGPEDEQESEVCGPGVSKSGWRRGEGAAGWWRLGGFWSRC